VALLPLWCEHIGLADSTTSVVFGIAAAVDVALFYPAGWVMDRYGRAWVAFPVVATVAAGVLLLPLTGTFLMVTLVACLVAVGNGMGSGIVMTMGADLAPSRGRAQFLGGWRLCGDIGNTGAPVVLGLVTTLVTLPVACIVTGLLCVGGTAWVTRWTLALDRLRAAARSSSSTTT
jgi:MFS family permease